MEKPGVGIFIQMPAKRKKIYYRPGLISLLLLPFLFLYKLPLPKKYTAIPFYVPANSNDDTDPYFRFSQQSLLKEIHKKKLIKIFLDDDKQLNQAKLAFIQQEARRIKFLHDTSSVIRVSLPKETTYGEFVQLINIMLIDQHKRYVLIDDDFYIFGEKP